jgi:ferredoxin
MVSLVFQRVDPYYALFHFWTGDVFFTALIVLGIVLLLSVFFERPWCRWLCPFGALLGIVQLISPWKIRRNTQMCTSCTLCSRACPMRISVHEKHSILDTRCNRCTECISSCQREGGLIYGPARLPFLRLKNAFMTGILALSLFSAPILFAHSAGFFKTSSKRPVTQGALRVEEIKGSMTLEELARGFDMDVTAMAGVLSIPPEIPDSTRLFDLEDVDESLTMKTLRERLEHYVTENRG